MTLHDTLADPRALCLAERRTIMADMASEQQHWLDRLRNLVEPPTPADDLPAFLLATPAFADLARRIGDAVKRSELDLEVADELDWFVAGFTNYLRTCDGEDSFAGNSRPQA